MSNYTVLERNIMHGLDDEDVCAMFLRLRERVGPLVAEKAAYEWRELRMTLEPMLSAAVGVFKRQGVVSEAVVPPDVGSEVLAFIRERQYRRYAPGN